MNILKYTEQSLSDRVAEIALGTVLDNNNVDDVVQSISRALAHGCRFVIIDCKKLEFLSSAGVGAIIGTVESFRDIEGDIVLCNVSDTICHVFRVLDLLEYLTIVETNQEAIAFCEKA